MNTLAEINERLKAINTLIENDEGTDELQEEKEALEARKTELSGDSGGEGGGKEDKGKTFTQRELDDIIQKRLDRAMAKAEEERKQAEELAKLTGAKRAEKELEIKELELEEERRVFRRERLELQTSKELDKLGIPIAFTEYVIAENAEETEKKINGFKELLEAEKAKWRVDGMKGATPPKGEQPGFKNPFSDEHLNLTEQGRLIREEPERAKVLQQQAKK